MLAKATEISSLRAVPYWGDVRFYHYKLESSADRKNWSFLGVMTANSNSITGTAHLSSESTLTIDPTDPFHNCIP